MRISTAKGTLIILAATVVIVGVFLWRGWADRLDNQNLAFFRAIEAGDVAALSRMLEEQPELATAIFGEEGTALHLAARFNQPAVAGLLIERGADLNARGQWGGTPLHWAGWWGSASAAEALIERGALLEDKGDAFGSTPLLWVCHGSTNAPSSPGDYLTTAEILIDEGAELDTVNAQGIPAIILASPPLAELLQEYGAKPPATRPADEAREEAPQLII